MHQRQGAASPTEEVGGIDIEITDRWIRQQHDAHVSRGEEAGNPKSRHIHLVDDTFFRSHLRKLDNDLLKLILAFGFTRCCSTISSVAS